FGRANSLAGENDYVAERGLLETAGEEGLRLTKHFSLFSDTQIQGIYDDPTIYLVDTKVFGVTDPALLPPPRTSLETLNSTGFKYHQDGLPTIHGSFQLRNARGVTSLPSEAVILHRNTFDYAWNAGISPTLRLRSEERR